MAREIYVVDENGGNLTHLTQNLPRGQLFMFGNYSWSPDGQYVIFTADINGTQRGPYQSTVYKASLDGSLAIVTGSEKSIYDWWNGITLLRDFEGTHSCIWLRPDGSQSTRDLCSADEISGIAHERSHNGDSVLGSNCSDGWTFYWANSDGTIVDKLLNSPIPSDSEKDNIFGMTWSQDDRFIAFLAWDTGGSGALYILDVEKARSDPSVEPLKMEGSYGPSWQPLLQPFP